MQRPENICLLRYIRFLSTNLLASSASSARFFVILKIGVLPTSVSFFSNERPPEN